MKRKQNYLKVGLVLTALALLPLAHPAMAEEQVPFEGVEVGAITTVSFQFPFDTKIQTAEGEAAHVGHYTLTGNFVVDVRVGTGAGTFTMTAANGDMLFLDMETHIDFPDLTRTITHYTVTGGTGRFEGATGSYTAHNQLAFFVGTSPNPYVGVLEGSISSPGTNKK